MTQDQVIDICVAVWAVTMGTYAVLIIAFSFHKGSRAKMKNEELIKSAIENLKAGEQITGTLPPSGEYSGKPRPDKFDS